MKKTQNALLTTLAILLAPAAATAAIYESHYVYDGSSLSLASGTELLGTALNVGDTLNLSYSALGAGSYWDFSSISVEDNVNLGFEYPGSCGIRSGHGAYSAQLNGVELLSSPYSIAGQGCVHFGPETIDFSSVSMLDHFSISFTLDSSTASANIIGSYVTDTWWQIWELFDGDTAFTFVPDPSSVPEPGSLALLGLGLAGLTLRRRKV